MFSLFSRIRRPFNGLSRLFSQWRSLGGRLCVVRCRYGCSYGHLCHYRRVYGYGCQRLYTGTYNARRHSCRYSSILGKNWRITESVTLANVSSSETANFPGAFASFFFGPQPLSLLFVVLLTSLGTWGLPQMVGKFYAIKSESSITKGTIISRFCYRRRGRLLLLGGFGRLSQLPKRSKADGYDNIRPVNAFFLCDSDLMIGVVLVSCTFRVDVHAFKPCSDVFVNDNASTLSHHAVKFDEKKKLMYARICRVFHRRFGVYKSFRQIPNLRFRSSHS